jgi:hypothetical protein
MLIFPDIAQKVHDETVRAVGEENLPRITDRSRLPYTEAVWKESLRWNPGTPLGKTLIPRSMEGHALIHTSHTPYKFSWSVLQRILHPQRNHDSSKLRVFPSVSRLASITDGFLAIASCSRIPPCGATQKHSDLKGFCSSITPTPMISRIPHN